MSAQRTLPFARRAAIMLAAATVAVAMPAAASAAEPAGPAIGANQYFTGVVSGSPSSGGVGDVVIGVQCSGAAATGTPEAGQFVEARLLIPPVTANTGFTGSKADSIRTDFVWSPPTSPVVVDLPFATLRAYASPTPVPTNIKVPCSGAGEVVFNPEPTSSTAVTSVVLISFRSVGVTSGS